MANPYNGSKRGKRGGSPDRPSRKPNIVRPLDPVQGYGQSDSARQAEAAIYYDCSEVREGQEWISPRRSLTRKLLLNVFPQEIEIEKTVLVTRQLDKVLHAKTGEIKLIQVQNPREGGYRVAWKSDKTLLRPGKNVQPESDLKRQSSRSKRIADMTDNPRYRRHDEDPSVEIIE